MNKKVKNKTLTKRKVNKFEPGGWKDNWKGDKLGGSISSTVSGIGSTVAQSMQLAQSKDNNSFDINLANNQSIIDKVKSQKPTASSFTELNTVASNLQRGNPDDLKMYLDYDEAGGISAGEAISGILSTAASGAVAGSSAGPIGTLVGGIGGFLLGGAGVATNVFNTYRNQKDYAMQAEIQKAKLDKANEDQNVAIDNEKNRIAKNTLNNFMLNNINAYGGPLFDHTGDWSNGLTFIDEGGTHEQNPFEGVMVGVDNQGVPNLVEEGEVIFGDYVFSNRLKPTKKILADGGFSDKYVDWTFAKIAEDLQKESAERPIDFISNNTLEDMMNRLITFQEMVREKKKSNSYKRGGLINKFDWGGTGHQYETKKEEKEALAALAEETAQLEALASVQASAIRRDTTNAYRKLLDSNTIPGMYDMLTKQKESPNINTQSKVNWDNLGRYLPAAVNAFSALYNASQKPDKLGYEYADSIMDYANNIPVATYDPIGGEMTTDLIDPNYLLNQHLAERASLNKAIKENARTSSTANMSLANASYSGQKADADALLAINRENNARKMQAAQHNLGIKQANRQGALSTQQLNINRGAQIANTAAQAANMKLGIDQFNLGQEQLHGQALSQGIGATANDIAGIATENYWANEIKDNPAFMEYIAMMNKAKNSSKCGGMLTRKRRK